MRTVSEAKTKIQMVKKNSEVGVIFFLLDVEDIKTFSSPMNLPMVRRIETHLFHHFICVLDWFLNVRACGMSNLGLIFVVNEELHFGFDIQQSSICIEKK